MLNDRYMVRAHALTADECKEMAVTLKAPVLGVQNRLSSAFDGSSGLQMVFTRRGICELESKFPHLGHFFATAASLNSNAFFLNTLVMQKSFKIKPHLDCSLNTFVSQHLTPARVSVLYVQVPSDLCGGDLELFDASGEATTIKPREGLLVQFQGTLVHGVTEGYSETERISLVLEEYDLEQSLLSQVPYFALEPTLERLPADVKHPEAYLKVQQLLQSLSDHEKVELQTLMDRPLSVQT